MAGVAPLRDGDESVPGGHGREDDGRAARRRDRFGACGGLTVRAVPSRCGVALASPGRHRQIGATPAQAAAVTELQTQLGDALNTRYVLERELGRGGMATVYLAHDLKHDRPVALKVLHSELAATLGPERFQREIRVAARLQHPHILPVHDSGETAGLLWFTMPYVAGESLRHRLRRQRPLPMDEAIRIAREIAAALDHAHRHGVVHRDVKPENILLTPEGDTLLADFGIARAVDVGGSEHLTGTGFTLGTPAYMSPEQASGELAIDGRSDVYSLGCVLYEMLTGEPPYTGPTAQAVILKRITEPAPSVRRLRPAVAPVVEDALGKALARAPDDRFAAAAAFAEALSGSAAPRTRAPSVAVLPFLSLSQDADSESFADGITEDVIAQLSKVRALKVISRTSAMAFKKREQTLREIAATLGVTSLLEGSVRRAGDRVRIVAQLIDAETDAHLWAETYDRQLTDIFAIQSDVALQIAAALKAELSPDERTRICREPTRDLLAYQLYVQGRHWLSQYHTEAALFKAVGYFEQALASDPGYALAHAGIALAYIEFVISQGGGRMNPEVASARARDAAARALELDGHLAEAHGVMALLRLVWDFDWTGAEAELKLALELKPGSADTYDHYGWLCWALGRHDEALALVRRAQELDPLVHRSDVASALLRAGQYEEAAQAAVRMIEFDPEYPRSYALLGWAYMKLGRHDEGLAELERSARLVPGDTMFLGQLGQAYALAGRAEMAREILRQLEELSSQRHVSPYHLAYVHTGLNDLDRAMDCLEQAFAERSGSIYGIKGSFLFGPLQKHPRFTALLRKMNLA